MDQLFLDELKDVYNAEKQLVAALPRMAKAAELPVRKPSRASARAKSSVRPGADPPVVGRAVARRKKCKGMEGLIEEGKEILEEEGAAEVIDAAIISAAQRVEIRDRGLRLPATYALLLGNTEADRL